MELVESLACARAGLMAILVAGLVPVQAAWLAAVAVEQEPVDPYRQELQYGRRTAPLSSTCSFGYSFMMAVMFSHV